MPWAIAAAWRAGVIIKRLRERRRRGEEPVHTGVDVGALGHVDRAVVCWRARSE